MAAKCPSTNTVAEEQENFWRDILNGNFTWDAHRIGWTIAGVSAAVTLLISLATVLGHGLHYHKTSQQRQIIRIVLFSPVFAIISFFSYRYWRSYTYYSLVEVVWEAVAIAAFLLLCLDYIAEGGDQAQRAAFAEKDKHKLPFPFCCWRMRPSKSKFLVLLKFSVVQYVIIRPLLSIVGIVLEYYDLLCEQSLSYKFGHVYLSAIDFASISVALYGLIVLYSLTKEDLKGKRPLAKFLTIKVVVAVTFYQVFIFSVLQSHGVIKGTQYWTSTNVANGLNALATCLEMVIVAAWQAWAFHWGEYRTAAKDRRQTWDAEFGKGGSGNGMAKKTSTALGARRPPRPKLYTNPLWALVHSLWLGDLFYELWRSLRFGFDRVRGKDYTKTDYRFASQRASKAYQFGSVGAVRQGQSFSGGGKETSRFDEDDDDGSDSRPGAPTGAGMDFSEVFFNAAAAKERADGAKGVSGSSQSAVTVNGGGPGEGDYYQYHQPHSTPYLAAEGQMRDASREWSSAQDVMYSRSGGETFELMPTQRRGAEGSANPFVRSTQQQQALGAGQAQPQLLAAAQTLLPSDGQNFDPNRTVVSNQHNQSVRWQRPELQYAELAAPQQYQHHIQRQQHQQEHQQAWQQRQQQLQQQQEQQEQQRQRQQWQQPPRMHSSSESVNASGSVPSHYASESSTLAPQRSVPSLRQQMKQPQQQTAKTAYTSTSSSSSPAQAPGAGLIPVSAERVRQAQQQINTAANSGAPPGRSFHPAYSQSQYAAASPLAPSGALPSHNPLRASEASSGSAYASSGVGAHGVAYEGGGSSPAEIQPDTYGADDDAEYYAFESRAEQGTHTPLSWEPQAM